MSSDLEKILKKKAPRRFEYGFLKSLRTLAPPGYILIDRALDIVGSLDPRIDDLKERFDFAEHVNVPAIPTLDSEGRKPPRRVVPRLSSFLSAHGPKLTLKTIDEPDQYQIELPPKVKTFRKRAWAEFLLVTSRQQLPIYYITADGSMHPIDGRVRTRLRRQSVLVCNVGVMWLLGEAAKPQLVVLVVHNSELRVAVFRQQLARTKLKKVRAGEEPNFLSDFSPSQLESHINRLEAEDRVRARISDDIGFILHSLNAYCVQEEERISQPIIIKCLEWLLPDEMLKLSITQRREVVKLFKADFEPQGFSDKGKGSSIADTASEMANFLYCFLDHLAEELGAGVDEADDDDDETNNDEQRANN